MTSIYRPVGALLKYSQAHICWLIIYLCYIPIQAIRHEPNIRWIAFMHSLFRSQWEKIAAHTQYSPTNKIFKNFRDELKFNNAQADESGDSR